jgi:hypothetical protein
VHNFYGPVNNQRVSRPRNVNSTQGNLAGKLEQEQEREGRFKVWGMTARVLVDAARVAFAEEPEIEHNEEYGDTNIIEIAAKDGVFEEIASVDRPKDYDSERGKI